jgi:hypothetical protein
MAAYSKSKEPQVRVEEMFLGLLGRPPRPAELQRHLEFIRAADDPVRATQDVYWVLINSSEFFFIH